MKTLGAILAGGSARRFGSDKAHALKDGKQLLDWVADSMTAQCNGVVVCGREEAGFACLPDRPQAGIGPLGGLLAALEHAGAEGYTHVLSAGVDVPNLPDDLVARLAGEGAAIIESQPVVGLWPASLATELRAFLAQDRRALYGFAEYVCARRITLDHTLMNVNHPEDLSG
ncbi:MAG: molybdenum cofactor guanylyltransferase [Pseudomonadota bacterium]